MVRASILGPIFVATMAAEAAAKTYQAEVDGDMTGRVLDVRDCGDERFAPSAFWMPMAACCLARGLEIQASTWRTRVLNK